MGKNFYMGNSQVDLGGPKISNTQLKKEADRLMTIYSNAQLELRDEELDGMKEAFEFWINDKTDIKKYQDLALMDPSRLLIRIFRFSKKNESTILGFSEKYKILPYAKVLQVGRENHTPYLVGDILYAPPALGKFEINIEWIAWSKSKEESPGIELPEPPKTQGLLENWRQESMFILDHFNRSPEDEQTFLRTGLNFPAIYKRSV